MENTKKKSYYNLNDDQKLMMIIIGENEQEIKIQIFNLLAVL